MMRNSPRTGWGSRRAGDAAQSPARPQGQHRAARAPGRPWAVGTFPFSTLQLWTGRGTTGHRAACHQGGTLCAKVLRKLAAGPTLAPWAPPAGPKRLFWEAVGLGARRCCWVSDLLVSQGTPLGFCQDSARLPRCCTPAVATCTYPLCSALTGTARLTRTHAEDPEKTRCLPGARPPSPASCSVDLPH